MSTPLPPATVVAPAVVQRPTHVDHWFYIGVGLFVIAISIAGFAPSMVDTSHRHAAPSSLVIAHVIVMAVWLLLFLAQAYLVATGRTAVHRRLGVLGAVLAAVIIVLGYVASVETTRRGHDLSGDIARAAGGTITPDGILFPLLAFFNFGVLVTAALVFRNRPQIHKRLMLFAMLQPVANEPIGHLYGHLAGYWPALLPNFGFVAAPALIVLLSVSAVHDRLSHGRIHPVSVWVPLALFVWMNTLFAVVVPSAAWLKLAERLID